MFGRELGHNVVYVDRAFSADARAVIRDVNGVGASGDAIFAPLCLKLHNESLLCHLLQFIGRDAVPVEGDIRRHLLRASFFAGVNIGSGFGLHVCLSSCVIVGEACVFTRFICNVGKCSALSK